MSKVVVGLSGGVDSAVTAYLLKEQGYEVMGVTLRTWTSSYGTAQIDSRCCEIDAARENAEILGIPYAVVDCSRTFRKCVTEPFVREYLRGRTPNPCVDCNRVMKWEGLLKAAEMYGAEYVATGHYAFTEQLPNGRYSVRQAASAQKDQTYMLYELTQEQLARTIMPLGPYTKDEVRAIAKGAGIPSANKADSQEICFVTEGSYAEYIAEESAKAGLPLPGPGDFVDEEGRVLGGHKGIIHYTVGQRKGLGIALGHPAYVKEIDTVNNRVVLAPEESLYSAEIFCDELHWMSIPGLEAGQTLPASVRIRYHHKGERALLEMTAPEMPAGNPGNEHNPGNPGNPDAGAADNAAAPGVLRIRFEKPVRAATPGQSAVFYDEKGYLIGGGKIC